MRINLHFKSWDIYLMVVKFWVQLYKPSYLLKSHDLVARCAMLSYCWPYKVKGSCVWYLVCTVRIYYIVAIGFQISALRG